MTSLISRIAETFGAKAEGNPLDDRYYEDFVTRSQGGSSLSGVNVSSESALRQAVFYRCISIRANTFADLPVGVYQRGDGRRTEIPDHALAKALARPNPHQSAFEWRRQIAHDWLVTGNAYNQITIDQRGRLQFYPLDPRRVREVTREGDAVRAYEFTRQNGERVRLVGDRDVWHIQAMGGRGLIDVARDTIGMAISAEQHSAQFFRRGVKVSGVLEHPARLKPDTAAAMGASFNAAFGGVAGHGKTPVLWEGMKYNPVSMTHHDAQFLETYREGLAGIATFCGIPLYMVGQIDKQTSWGTGIEEQNLAFVQFTVQPDVTHFEQECERVFLDSGEGTGNKYVRFSLAGLMRGRTKERYEVYQIAIASHIMTPNEARAFEDMDPIEGGDDFPAVPGAQIGEAPNHDPSKGAEDLTDPPDSEPAKPKRMKATDKTEQLARWIAGDLLRAEAAGLMEIAKTTASDPEKWARAVSAYYGRRKGTIVESLSITPEQAEAWCKEQSRLASEGGAAALTTWTEHTGRLVALALETKEGEE